MSNEKILLADEKPDSNELAIERTIMAAERTLMSWTRTSISLISFGFTIYKFIQFMQEQGKAIIIKDPAGPRNFGMALIAIGAISLLVASIQYRQLQRKLKPEKKLPFSLSVAVAWAIILLGIFALANILFQSGPF